jgi:hypothetical protein
MKYLPSPAARAIILLSKVQSSAFLVQLHSTVFFITIYCVYKSVSLSLFLFIKLVAGKSVKIAYRRAEKVAKW